MKRPCVCNRFRKGEAFDITRDCRVCWLYAHDPEYNKCGPGTELKNLLESLGLKGNAGCNCNAKADDMDRWGVDGCKQRRDEIVGWLRENAKERGWVEKAKSAALALKTGIAFQLDFSDLYGSLVDLAIERADTLHP